MSQNFTLTISNPGSETSGASVVQGAAGGNTLDLTIANNVGYPFVVAGGADAACLVVQISNNIIDEAGASALTVASPWTLSSYQAPPDSSPAQNFTFNLQPPAGGVGLPVDGTLTVELRNVAPSAPGVGVVLVQYQFADGPAMNAYATLTSLPAPDNTLPPLIGSPGGLGVSVSVNGSAGNALLVSGTPVDSDSAIANTLSLTLLFQVPDTSDTTSLVSGWPPNQTPTLRIFFPYADADATLPAPLALTDDVKSGATGYDPITSAWNIQASLDPTNPAIQKNTYWQVSCDTTGPGPVWVVQPAADNVSLFTNTENDASQPGPTLTLYWQHIVSALPIGDSPGTIIYVQWTGFPGFADGAVANLLPKSAFLIDTFDVALIRTDSGPLLTAHWTTTGAHHCVISGNTSWQQTNQTTGYTQGVTASTPMLQTYTLTAYPTATEDSPITRSVTAQWIPNSSTGSVQTGNWRKLATTPDGKFVLATNPLLGNSSQVFDAETLTAVPVTWSVDRNITGFAFWQDLMYVTSVFGRITSYDTTANFATLASSASPVTMPFSPRGAIDTLIAISQDGQTIAQTYWSNPDNDCALALIGRTTLEPRAPATLLSARATALAVGRLSGSLYLATNQGLMIRDATFGTATRTISVQAQYIWQLAVSPDELSLYVQIDVNGDGLTNALARIDVATGVTTVQVSQALSAGGTTPSYSELGNLAVTPDGATLFLLASAPQGGTPIDPTIDSTLGAYDATTLEELSWSPITFGTSGDEQPLDMALAADGSRLFVLALPGRDVWALSVLLYAVDPVFSS